VDVIPLLFVLLPVLILVIGAISGRVQEQRHERSLARRAPLYAGITVTDLRTPPPGVTPTGAHLVVGHVVVGSDRGKQFVATLKNLIGGEVRSFETLLARARREALLRMLEEARRAGASLVINTRFETSEITDLAAEILCYGTAVSTAPRHP
jgi:uncharacterized protein YbjQ (UPF0145 family)